MGVLRQGRTTCVATWDHGNTPVALAYLLLSPLVPRPARAAGENCASTFTRNMKASRIYISAWNGGEDPGYAVDMVTAVTGGGAAANGFVKLRGEQAAVGHLVLEAFVDVDAVIVGLTDAQGDDRENWRRGRYRGGHQGVAHDGDDDQGTITHLLTARQDEGEPAQRGDGAEDGGERIWISAPRRRASLSSGGGTGVATTRGGSGSGVWSASMKRCTSSPWAGWGLGGP